jgi:hypothetical protein
MPLWSVVSKVKIPDLPCSPIIDLRAIKKSNHHVGIIEMRFTAGENLTLPQYNLGHKVAFEFEANTGSDG